MDNQRELYTFQLFSIFKTCFMQNAAAKTLSREHPRHSMTPRNPIRLFFTKALKAWPFREGTFSRKTRNQTLQRFSSESVPPPDPSTARCFTEDKDHTLTSASSHEARSGGYKGSQSQERLRHAVGLCSTLLPSRAGALPRVSWDPGQEAGKGGWRGMTDRRQVSAELWVPGLWATTCALTGRMAPPDAL